MNPFNRHYDVAIVGSGAGGGTLAYGLARRGYKVLLLEQGGQLPREADNTTDNGAFGRKYMSVEPMEICGRRHNFPFHAYVGGATKFYGAALYRLREQDFGELQFADGVSPAWPIRYADLEPYYTQAEALYKVHGDVAGDPTEPPHSKPYRFPPIPHEPQLERFLDRLRRQGLHVSAIPKAIDAGDERTCRVCGTCDGYACPTDGKLDTEVACIRPALSTGNLTLVTHAQCRRLITNAAGDRVIGIELRHEDRPVTVEAGIYVLACGVVRSPAILLRSANQAHPNGLANSSGLVGRYLSGHNANFLVIPTFSQVHHLHHKTFAVNDYYLGAPDAKHPLGVLQAAGRMPIWLYADRRWARVAEFIARRSVLCFSHERGMAGLRQPRDARRGRRRAGALPAEQRAGVSRAALALDEASMARGLHRRVLFAPSRCRHPVARGGHVAFRRRPGVIGIGPVVPDARCRQPVRRG